MGHSASASRRRTRLGLESLESRAVPATFGVPWSDPSHLTISFAPDGTAIAGHTSTLASTLNPQLPTATWQREILQAFQTWAVNANINIGLVADGGQAFGVAGKSQHDARFGDVRVGAQAMTPEVLSISVPNDPAVSSSLTGDVLVNSSDKFNAKSLDLFAVMLHEAGHVFGIGDGVDPKSPMFSKYTGNLTLTAADVAALQAQYGVRAPDANEGSSGNDSISRATTIPIPGGNSTTPLIAYGDVTTAKDLDFFSFRAPNNYAGPVTVRLQSAGISLLAPQLTVLDAKGNVVGTARAASGFGDVVNVRIAKASPNATYYVKVQGATADVFGIGGYGLAVSFDAATTVTTATIDSVLRGPYQSFLPNDIQTLLLGKPNPLFNDDHGANDDLIAATQLVSKPGYARNSHYEAVGSTSGPTDVDYYRITTADSPKGGLPLVLTVTARSMDVNGATPRVAILDRDGLPVPSQVIANGDGTFTVQAAGVKPGGNYFLKVGPGTASGSASTGNYALEAQFGAAAANLSVLASGTLNAASPSKAFNFYVGESQLMNLVLAADGAAVPGSAVRMTLTDSKGRVVYTLTTAAGDVTSGAALFLTPGAYSLRFTVLGTQPVAFRLLGDGISDPVGPALSDPTLTPAYNAPGLPGWFLYPGGVLSTVPYLVAARPTS